MKKTLPQIFTILIFLLAACEQNLSATQTAPISVVDTTTPSPLLIATRTFIPSTTPTASINLTEALESIYCLPNPIQVTPSEGSHIGLRTPPELNGIKSLDAVLVQSGDEFSIGLNLMLEGQEQYLFWLEKFCDNQNGQRFTEVIDEIILSPLKEGEFTITTCQLKNETNSHAVATGYYREEIISGATYKKVIATQAWLINYDEWSFMEIPAEQLGEVSCIHEY